MTARIVIFGAIEAIGLVLIILWVLDRDARYALAGLITGIVLAIIGNVGVLGAVLNHLKHTARIRAGQCPACGRDREGRTGPCPACGDPAPRNAV